MQLAEIGTASGSVGIPLRNMHTQVEIADLKDIESTIKLLVTFISELTPDCDLMPIVYDESGEKKADNNNLNIIGYKSHLHEK